MKPEQNGINQEKETGEASAPVVHTASPGTLDEATLLELEGESASVLASLHEPWAARLAGRMGRHHAALMITSVVLLWLVMALPGWRGTRDLEVGKPSPRDIVAPVSALVIDSEATAARRREAAALLPPKYVGDPRAVDQALNKLHAQIEIRRSRNDTTGLHWDAIENAASDAVRSVYRGGQIRSDVTSDIDAARSRLTQSIPRAATRWKLDEAERDVATDLGRRVTRFPNLVADERGTQRARREAQNEAPSVYESVKSGEVLVQAGEVVTPQKWAQLEDLNMVAPRFDLSDIRSPFWKRSIAYIGLCALLVLFASAYLATLDRSLLKRPAALWLAAMTPVLFLALFRFVLKVPHGDTLLVPLAAAAAILLTILLEARLGILTGVLIAAPGVLLARGDASLFLAAVFSAWAGALSVANITSRRQIAQAAMLLTAANAALSLISGILSDAPVEQTISLMCWSALCGVLAVIAGSGLAMVLERPFGITTHLHLLELLAPDEVVLRRLQTEAPGTYTHSLMVSLMAEAAAKNVDADSLLCRVGGLYHDIGKLHRPHCFIENQSGENIHDRLSPQLSARIIVAHVRDGLALGRALKLPQPVLDIIAQHHGTTRTEYFFRRAMDLSELPDTRLALHVDEDEFRYPGPKPQSKECAIVMLADTIEASARALPQPTLEKLEQHIASMIGQKLREGELAECDLTLRDLQTVQNSFLHVLRGVLHQRITYPSAKGETVAAEDDLAEMSAQLRGSRRGRKMRRAQQREKNAAAQAAAGQSQKEASSRVQQALAESFIGRRAARLVPGGKEAESAQPKNGNSTNGGAKHTNGHNGHGSDLNVKPLPLRDETALLPSESVKIESAEANR